MRLPEWLGVPDTGKMCLLYEDRGDLVERLRERIKLPVF